MKEVGRMLYGSNNYQLDGPDSDRDYKVVMMPSFHDLYVKHEVGRGDLPEQYNDDHEHFGVTDVRDFSKRVLQGNVNYVEYLFSCDCTYNHPDFAAYCDAARDLFKDGYLAVVWATFYKSLFGLVHSTLKRCPGQRKGLVRSFYYYLLCATVSTGDFSMTQKTWRYGVWQKCLQQMRFDESYKVPSEVELRVWFSQLEETTRKRAEDWCEKHPDKVLNLNARADHLRKSMEEFVKKEMLRDCGVV